MRRLHIYIVAFTQTEQFCSETQCQGWVRYFMLNTFDILSSKTNPWQIAFLFFSLLCWVSCLVLLAVLKSPTCGPHALHANKPTSFTACPIASPRRLTEAVCWFAADPRSTAFSGVKDCLDNSSLKQPKYTRAKKDMQYRNVVNKDSVDYSQF